MLLAQKTQIIHANNSFSPVLPYVIGDCRDSWDVRSETTRI